jgi:hypothetical protein
MMPLVGREVLGESIHRGAGGSYDLANFRRDGGLENIERSVNQHLKSEPRLLSALRDSDRRLVTDHVLAGCQVMDELTITKVAVYEGDPAGRKGVFQIRTPSTHEIVEYINVCHTDIE